MLAAPLAPNPLAPAAGDGPSRGLLDLVRALHAELHGAATHEATVALDSAFDRDLGFDSLTRVELLLRVERTFGLHLPDHALDTAQTPRELLRLMDVATPTGAAADRALPTVADDSAESIDTGATPSQAQTLLEVLDWHLQRHPQRVQIVLLDGEREQRLRYADLWRGAQARARQLQALGIAPRQTVALMLPTGADYFLDYLGILLIGAVPVPIYPPARPEQLEEHVRRHAGILANAGVVALLTVPEARPVAQLLKALVPGLAHIVTDSVPAGETLPPQTVAVAADDIAFLQYTSGSTGDPKGVALTHGNLLANIRAIHDVLQLRADDVFVSWLPLYHDMGLIGAWLTSLYTGNRLVVMSPLDFLRRPLRWLQAISRYRGTHTAAPNFAYALCLRHADAAACAGLDLSSLRLAANGAEPVDPDTLQRFAARFAACGLQPQALTPVYGLAENAVALLISALERPPVVDAIDRETFMRSHHARPAAAGDPDPLRFVACGQVLPGHRVRLIDDLGEEVAERVEGRLEFQGPSATVGYYRRPDDTARLLHEGWLDSGDRAYRAEGEIYITGRVKDIIIRGGRNIYPQDIERAASELPGVRKGGVVAFGVDDTALGTERLVVLAETAERNAAVRASLTDAIRERIVTELGTPPDEVVLAPPHAVLKTSSGKLRRAATRDLWLAGGLGASAQPPWRQWLRLARSALAAALGRNAARAAHGLYGLWWWPALGLVTLLAWPLVALTRKPARAWTIAHHAARSLLWLSGQRLQVQGLNHLPAQPHLLLPNHASDLDGLVLVAALARPYRFVAKRELLRNPIARVFLRRLGTEFVERFDAQGSVDAAQRLAQAAAQGQSLCVFPEGTFRRDPGLLPFHLGPFEAAVQAGLPVVPAVLRGTRTALADGQRLPHRGALHLAFGTPLTPRRASGDAVFAAAAQLRDATRAAIEQGLLGGESGNAASGASPPVRTPRAAAHRRVGPQRLHHPYHR